MVDYYKVLKIKRTASSAEIKSAYRRLARERHPDVNGGTEAAAREFALISLAYRTLSDPQERAHHETHLKRGKATTSWAGARSSTQTTLTRSVCGGWPCRRASTAGLTIIEADRPRTRAPAGGLTTVTLFSRHSSSHGSAALLVHLPTRRPCHRRHALCIGLWHLAGRRRRASNITLQPEVDPRLAHQCDKEESDKPFTRFTASTFLILGYLLSLAGGLMLRR